MRGAARHRLQRGHHHPAGLPRRRQRVRDQQDPLPPARHPQPLHGHRHRPHRLLDHGAGEDRPDPLLPPRGPAAPSSRRRPGSRNTRARKRRRCASWRTPEANLIRLADIIREVKRQIGSLQRQAGKARRYQSAFEELAGLEHRLGRRQFETYSKLIAGLQDEVENRRRRQEELDLEVSGQEQKVAGAREELSLTDADLIRLREELGSIRHALERAEQRAASNRERVAEFTGLRDQAPAGNRRDGREGARRRGAARPSQRPGGEFHPAARRNPGAVRRGPGSPSPPQRERSARSRRSGRKPTGRGRRRNGSTRSRNRNRLAALELQQRNFQLRIEALQSEHTSLAQRHEASRAALTGQAGQSAAAGTRLQEQREAWERAQQERREAAEKLQEAEQALAGIGADPSAGAGPPRSTGPARGAACQRAAGDPGGCSRRVSAKSCTAPFPNTFPSRPVTRGRSPFCSATRSTPSSSTTTPGRSRGARNSKRANNAPSRRCGRPVPPLFPPARRPTPPVFLAAQPKVGHLVAAPARGRPRGGRPRRRLAAQGGPAAKHRRHPHRRTDPRSGLLLVGQEAGASLAVLTRAVGAAPARGRTGRLDRRGGPGPGPRGGDPRRPRGKDRPGRAGPRRRSGSRDRPRRPAPGGARRPVRARAGGPPGGGGRAGNEPADGAGAGRSRAPRAAAGSDERGGDGAPRSRGESGRIAVASG